MTIRNKDTRDEFYAVYNDAMKLMREAISDLSMHNRGTNTNPAPSLIDIHAKLSRAYAKHNNAHSFYEISLRAAEEEIKELRGRLAA